MSKGFTLVELSLSIAFIAVLSIIVVVMISNAVSSYHKGMTMNQINTVGVDLVDNIRTTIQDSPARSVISECSVRFSDVEQAKACENDGARSFVSLVREGKIKIGNNETEITVPMYGVFCTGAYSYVWNSGYFDNNEIRKESVRDKASVKYALMGGSVAETPAGLLWRFQDDDRLACKNAAVDGSGKYLPSRQAGENLRNVFDVSEEKIADAPIDLLTSNANLAVYDLEVAAPAADGGSTSAFYTVSFILGTVAGGIDLKASGDYCKTPSSYNSAENFDYCAINKFNFAAQAAGG